MQGAKPGFPGCIPDATQARNAASRRLGCASLAVSAKLTDDNRGKSAKAAE
jgi:hypothetical protein